MKASLVLESGGTPEGRTLSVDKEGNDFLRFMIGGEDPFYLHPDDCAAMLNFISAFGGEG